MGRRPSLVGQRKLVVLLTCPECGGSASWVGCTAPPSPQPGPCRLKLPENDAWCGKTQKAKHKGLELKATVSLSGFWLAHQRLHQK